MKDKINWKECMKRKCEQCKYYNRCFKKEKKDERKNDKKTGENINEKYNTIS